MATSRSFQAMLNQYLPEDLLREEMLKRDFFLQNVKKVNDWRGGSLIIPFEGAAASSVSFGALTDAADVAEYQYVRGQVNDYSELHGTLRFNQRDLYDHSGRINEDSFLKILPDQVENFMQYMKEVLSVHLLNGAAFASAKSTLGTSDLANGIIEVTNIDRFVIGMRVTLDDADSNENNQLYVTAININNETVTLSATRGGAAANLSAFTVAQSARFYHPGVFASNAVTADAFVSVPGLLLSQANGGLTQAYGVNKTAWPFLQAQNVNSSDITETNILEKLLDAYTLVRSKARGNASTIMMSYKHLGSILKLIELQKGGFKVTPTSTKASLYGWTEIELGTVKGNLKIVGDVSMPDNLIYLLDMDTWTFYSNGMFRKRTAPDGKSYFEVRATTGFTYLVDVSCFGQLVCNGISKNAVLHSINY